MPIKLNINRTQIIEVPVPDQGSFSVEMTIPKKDDPDKNVSDLIVSVTDLELSDEQGNAITGKALVTAVKNCHQLSALVLNAWTLGNQNIIKKQQTLLEPFEA